MTTSYPATAGDAAGHFVETEARLLLRQGHEVHVLSPFGRVPPESFGIQHIQVAGTPLFGWPGALERLRRAPWLLPQAGLFAASVRRALARLAPLDRVVAHWLVPSAWPACLGGTPVSAVAHGSDVRLLQRLPRALARRILTDLLARGASFRCVSEALARDLVLLCPAIAECVYVEPCAIDIGQAPNRARARAELGVGEQKLVLVLARLVAAKRTRVALAAAALLPGVRVAVAGDGPERASLEADFPEVHFLGRLPRPEALTWLAAADVLLSPSRDEGAPTVVREALALGVDVVAFPSGDLRLWARREPLLWLTGPAGR